MLIRRSSAAGDAIQIHGVGRLASKSDVVENLVSPNSFPFISKPANTISPRDPMWRGLLTHNQAVISEVRGRIFSRSRSVWVIYDITFYYSLDLM